MRILDSSVCIGVSFGNGAKVLGVEDFQILLGRRVLNVVFPTIEDFGQAKLEDFALSNVVFPNPK